MEPESTSHESRAAVAASAAKCVGRIAYGPVIQNEPGLTTAEIRAAVSTYAAECLDTFDKVTSMGLINPYTGAPMPWTAAMRVEVFLTMWARYNPTRPN